MKKPLLLVIASSLLIPLAGYSQLFSQNFNNSTDITQYVTAAGAANKFTSISSAANNVISAANNSVNFTKTGNSTGYFIRNVNFASTAPTVLRVSFSFEVSNSTVAGTTEAQFYIGSGFSNSATAPGGSITHSKIVFDFGNSNNFNIHSSTSPTTPTSLYSGKQNIIWVINNSGSTISYTAPDGTTIKSLATNKWDLYVGSSSSTPVLPDRSAITNGMALQNFAFHYANGSENATLELDDLTIEDQTTVLPVTLTSFLAKTSLDGIKLDWQTASEQNNSHFDILRSTDGKVFSKISAMTGAGTTSAASYYSFTDKFPAPGVNYYQLSQVDNDGKTTLSSVVSAKSDAKPSSLAVFPSADKQFLNFSIYKPEPSLGTLAIYDLMGRKVAEQPVSLDKGYNSISLPSAGFSTGINVARLISGTELLNFKFIKPE